MSLTLYINKSDAHCECSFKGVDYRENNCPYCGGTWDTVSSDYAGGGMHKSVMKCRPDLEPYFPWENWWKSDEGQTELAAFRAELQMTTTSEPDTEWEQATFQEWVEEWFRLYDPADFAYPDVMAERLVEEMRDAGFKVVRP